MAITEQITCDGCGKPKQSTNHWFTAEVYENSVIFHLGLDSPEPTEKHLCGQACAIKILSEWMQKGKG